MHCDGQVLVIYDLLGMNDAFKPRFVRKYDNFAMRIRTAADAYVNDVRSGAFPATEESFSTEAAPRAPTGVEASAPVYSTVNSGSSKKE